MTWMRNSRERKRTLLFLSKSDFIYSVLAQNSKLSNKHFIKMWISDHSFLNSADVFGLLSIRLWTIHHFGHIIVQIFLWNEPKMKHVLFIFSFICLRISKNHFVLKRSSSQCLLNFVVWNSADDGCLQKLSNTTEDFNRQSCWQNSF